MAVGIGEDVSKAFAGKDSGLDLYRHGCYGAFENRTYFSTYFYGSDAHGIHSIVGERFASLVQREICARTDLLNCRTHAKTWDLLRLTKAPTVRVDLGYLSNQGDRNRLARPDFRDTLAEAFIIAIQRLYLAAEDDAKTGTLRISDLRNAGIRR